MQFQITIMIVPRDQDTETTTSSWRTEKGLNHIDAIEEAQATLNQMAYEERDQLPDETEGLSIIAQPIPEFEGDEVHYWPAMFYRRNESHDQRDPTGKIKRYMLSERHHKTLGSEKHEADQQWEKDHLEFAVEYLLELQKREREELALKLGGANKQEWWQNA
jgi:hypothetical protein